MKPTLLKLADSGAAISPVRMAGHPAALEFPRIATRRARILKRGMDLLFGGIGALFALPLVALIALAVWLESGGPVLYAHERIGRGGKRFRIYKFRSMVVDGDELLERRLEEDPEARREWAESHKLRNDPRVTRTGRLLRRTSMDELPQFYNVLRGEMSLAGPRPIVDREIPRYGAAFPFYTLVRPGLTGLWQVSGRNDTTYGQRVELDVAYVRRWSPWLDLQLFLRTIRVVVLGHGAY